MAALDGLISPDEERYIRTLGARLGLTSTEIDKTIAGELRNAATRAIPPTLDVSPTKFELSDLKPGTLRFATVTIRNAGGGVLSGTIASDRSWLKVGQREIDTSRHQQDIEFEVDPAGLQAGRRDTGTIVIRSNGGMGHVEVTASLRATVKPRKRRRRYWVAAMVGFVIISSIIYNAIRQDPLTLESARVATESTDDFSDPDSGWDSSQTWASSSRYVNGRYVVTVTQPQRWSSRLAPVSYDTPHVAIAVRAGSYAAPDTEFGVACRLDGENGYLFLVRRQIDSIWGDLDPSDVEVVKVERGEWMPLVDERAAVPPSHSYRLEAICIGSHLVFEVNGTEVAHLTDSSLRSGWVGVVVGTGDHAPAGAWFDNVSVDTYVRK